MAFVPRDRGRWLYRERRISRGRVFEVLKFRVLREDVLAEAAATRANTRACTRRTTSEPDPTGRIIKRIYADELPQLFNVVRGDISLVGPAAVAGVDGRGAGRHKGLDYRLHVVAGWTGPAQVRKDSKARSQATALDLEYVELCRTLSGMELVRHDLRVLRPVAARQRCAHAG